jgi:hypothetical protein
MLLKGPWPQTSSNTLFTSSRLVLCVVYWRGLALLQPRKWSRRNSIFRPEAYWSTRNTCMDVNVQSTTWSTTQNPSNRIRFGSRSYTTSSSLRQWRIWIVYYKSEEDLDHLPQVGVGFGSSTTSWRRTSHHPSKGSSLRWLLRLHQWRSTLIKQPPGPECASNFVGRAQASDEHGALQATWFSPPFFAFNLVGHRKGTESSKLPNPSPLFCAINPNNLSGLELFQDGKNLNSSMTISLTGGHPATRRWLLFYDRYYAQVCWRWLAPILPVTDY